jgi:hypothetical protein
LVLVLYAMTHFRARVRTPWKLSRRDLVVFRTAE